MSDILAGSEQFKAAEALLKAAYDFWLTCPDSSAVRWLEDTDGKVIIFTRGEYRDTLLRNIDKLPGHLDRKFERIELNELES